MRSLLIACGTLLQAALPLAAAKLDEPKPFLDFPSVSPDGRFAIEFKETRRHVLLYEWVRLHPRQVLLAIKSGYQPDKEDTDSAYERGYAETATVQWSKDSRSVAINEAVQQGGGEIHAAYLASKQEAKLIHIPEDEIYLATGEQWRRSRLWVDYEKGWSGDSPLHIYLSGEALAEKHDPSDTPKLQKHSYSVTLRRKGDRFVILKVEKAE